MTRTEFWKVVLASSLISAGLVVFLLRWPSPPAAEAVYVPPAATLADRPLSEDEAVNVYVYETHRKGVVNVISTTIEYTWFFDPVSRKGVGSGFVVDDSGHIVTNYHVIQGAEGLDVTLWDNSKYEAKVVGVDQINDLAVIRIDCPKEKLVPLELGTRAAVKVGQKVLAIGNPFGLELTLTTGIVSSLGRKIETENAIIDEIIQTDAAINPGNSGGPLLNTSGEVIGVNTMIYSRSGDSAGVGFAVPVATVARVLPDLIAHGKVRRPWLGIRRAVRLTGQLARALELPVEQGLLIEKIDPGSSLEKAGLRGGDRQARWRRYILIIGGDVLVSLNGQSIQTEKDLGYVLEGKRPGDSIEVVFYRNGERREQTVRLIGRENERRFRF